METKEFLINLIGKQLGVDLGVATDMLRASINRGSTYLVDAVRKEIGDLSDTAPDIVIEAEKIIRVVTRDNIS